VKLTRVDQAERLLGTITEQDRVADHLSLEVDIGFGDRGDVFELEC